MFGKLKKSKKSDTSPVYSQESPETTSPMGQPSMTPSYLSDHQIAVDEEGYRVVQHSDPFERVQQSNAFNIDLDEEDLANKRPSMGALQVQIKENATEDTVQSTSELTSAVQKMNALTVTPVSSRRRKPPPIPETRKATEVTPSQEESTKEVVQFEAVETINVLYRGQELEKSLVTGDLSLQAHCSSEAHVTIQNVDEIVVNDKHASKDGDGLIVQLQTIPTLVPIAKYRVTMGEAPISLKIQSQTQEDRSQIMLILNISPDWLQTPWQSLNVVAKIEASNPQIQSKPPAQWMEDKQSLYWKLPVEGLQEQTKLLARISPAIELGPVAINFVTNKLYSSMQLDSEDVEFSGKGETKSGKYIFSV